MSAIAKTGALIREVAHGAALKAVALAFRLVFLLFTAPALAGGVLAAYVFASSVAAIAARIAGLGLEEQLPISVAGERARAGGYARFAERLLGAELLLLVASLVADSMVLFIVLLAVCYLNTSFLAGFLRTLRIEGSERLRDLHWVFFVGLSLLPRIDTANELLASMSVSLILVQCLEIGLNRRQSIATPASLSQTLVELGQLARLSWKKLFAGAIMVAIVRAMILWPNMLQLAVTLDSLAYALLMGEAFWQTAMILVYRRYALYCRHSVADRAGIPRDVAKIAVILLVYSAVAASVAVGLGRLEFQIAGFTDWSLVASMIVFFVLIAIYTLIRYGIWVLKDFDVRLIVLEVTMFLGQGIAVASLPVRAWPVGACTSTLICTVIAFALLLHVSRQINARSIGEFDDG